MLIKVMMDVIGKYYYSGYPRFYLATIIILIIIHIQKAPISTWLLTGNPI